MRKTIGIVCITIIVVSLVFGIGYLQGRRAGTNIMGGIVKQLERDISTVRQSRDAIRSRVIDAEDSINSGAGRLEESLTSITRLGSVTAQIRGFAQAIRDHVEVLRSTAETLESVRRSIDTPSISN